jgi:hypothetical protein
MPPKSAPFDHEKDLEEQSVASLRSLVNSTIKGKSSPTNNNNNNNSASNSSSIASLGLIGIGAETNTVQDFFTQYDVILAEPTQSSPQQQQEGTEEWPRRGQYVFCSIVSPLIIHPGLPLPACIL